MRPLFRLLPVLFLFAYPLLGAKPAEKNENAPPLNEKAILLPEVTIAEKMQLRPEEKWLTGTVGNFEVFSTASEKETKDFVTKLYKFHNAFTYLFPKANSLAREKVILVLCGTIDKFQALTTVMPESETRVNVSQMLGDSFSTYLVINIDVKSSFLAPVNVSGGDTESIASLDGQHTGTEFIDSEELMRRQYIHLLFSHSNPRPPAWLEEGVSRYFSSIKINPKSITYAQLTKEITYFFKRGKMLGMDELLNTTHESLNGNATLGGVFSDQSFMFVHFGMFAYKMRYQKAFLTFIDRAAKEPVTEAMFKEVFKMSYGDMESELRDYVEGGLYRGAIAPKTADFPPAPTLVLHTATDAEAGRIKGDTLRLVKRYDDARIELISPIMRKHADARLIGALGLLDFETGNLTAARKYLEQSTNAKVTDPAPYLTLAKMREHDAITNNPGAKLTPAQLSPILTPLYAALALNQPPVEIYLAIADAWDCSKNAPTFDNLVVLDQGVIAYPRNTELIFKNASLKARYGFTDDARSLADLGLKVARDDATRNRFADLKASLPIPAGK